MLKKIMKKGKNNKGFTLVELLVVIAIIGILAVVAVPSLMKNINKAKASEAVSYINAIRTAAISEFAETQPEAPDVDDVKDLIDNPDNNVTVDSIGVNSDKTGLDIKVTVPDAILEYVRSQMGNMEGITVQGPAKEPVQGSTDVE